MSEALLVGFAAVYVWYLFAHATILDRPLRKVRDRFSPLIGCPWCLSLWTTAIMLLATGNYDPITHLAAAGVAGLAGSHSG